MKTIKRVTRLSELEDQFLIPNFVFDKIRDKKAFFEENYIGPNLTSARERNNLLRKLGKGMSLSYFDCFYVIKECKTPKFEIVRYDGNDKKYWNHYWKYPFILIGSRDGSAISEAFLSGTIKNYQTAPYDWTKRLILKTTYRVATVLSFERFLQKNFVYYKETDKIRFMKDNCLLESWYGETADFDRVISNMTESEVFDDQPYSIYVIKASKSKKYEIMVSELGTENRKEITRLSQAFRNPFFIINSNKGVLIDRHFGIGIIKGFDFILKTKSQTMFFKK